MRPLSSNHAKYDAAVTSNTRQNSGHQFGTPGLEMMAAWVRSKMPCAASAAATTQSDHLKPVTASARKTALAFVDRKSHINVRLHPRAL